MLTTVFSLTTVMEHSLPSVNPSNEREVFFLINFKAQFSALLFRFRLERTKTFSRKLEIAGNGKVHDVILTRYLYIYMQKSAINESEKEIIIL